MDYKNELLNQGIIVLPVPFGTKLYQGSTDCCNVCYTHKKKRQELKTRLGEEQFACSSKAICHTRASTHVYDYTVDFNSIKFVLDEFGKTLFLTKGEALIEVHARVANHRAIMESFGFEFDDEGKLTTLKEPKDE